MVERREAIKRMGAVAGTLAAGALTRTARAAKPAKPRIKVGQIGVGHAHARSWACFGSRTIMKSSASSSPMPSCGPKPETDETYRDLPWMTQEQLLNQPGLQAVLVETRVRDLLDTAEACVAAGKHVHLDKPAGESLPQYRRILDEAARQALARADGLHVPLQPGGASCCTSFSSAAGWASRSKCTR